MIDGMNAQDHDDITRKSFEQQVGLFVGDDSPFARAARRRRWRGSSRWTPAWSCSTWRAAQRTPSEVAAPHVRQVVGIDLTPALLAIGAERLRGAGITNVLLQEGHAAALPFVDASFDLVFCRTALHHFPQPEQCVAEMARVCRPGGRVVVSDMIAPSAAGTRRVRRPAPPHRSVARSHALLEAEIADLLGRAVGPLDLRRDGFDEAADRRHADRRLRSRCGALTALQRDLDGTSPTGFDPVLTDDGIVVSFIGTVVHATRT